MSDDGSEDLPPRPVRRKIKNVMIVSSASDSDSDGSVVAPTTRRKRMRVLSDDGASSSSSSDGSAVVARRKRALPALRDSDAESDSSGWATDRSAPAEASTAQPKKTSGFSSDSSEGNSDKCSICLLRFKDQEVGTPETCEHLFCLDCITEWSRNVNTCPVDRITFNSIVVRNCAGGRVLRTEPVKVVERRPSVEVMVIEDPTHCEICGSTDNEESMLLCDGCDLGFHMQCLDPPLTQVPPDQWLCPNCDNLLDDDLLDIIEISELDDLFSGMADLDMPEGPRAVALRAPRNVRRSTRRQSAPSADQPSTSSGRRGSANLEAPSTSRGTRTSRSSRAGSSRATTRRRTTGAHRRKYKRRRARTVIIEYELQDGGKFPVTKTVKRKLKKKKSRKRPRTAARRSHVRASVRAKLADMRLNNREDLAQTFNASSGVRALSVSRQRAGITALSLFGNPHQLEYFEEEEDVSEGASVAVSVASRPTSAIASAYRQARRKMSIPSPTHASAAPDILSSILESQALLHSKRAVLSVTVDGQVDITLHKRDSRRELPKSEGDSGGSKDGRVDVSKSGAESSRKTPMYSGGGGRGWGGGYRGGRVPPAAPRDTHHHNHQEVPRQGHPGGAHHGQDSYTTDYSRRPPYGGAGDMGGVGGAGDDPDFDRRRESGRDRHYPHRPDRGRHSFGAPSWRYNNYSLGPDRAPPPHTRHSFGGGGGGYSPLDMRTGVGASGAPPSLLNVPTGPPLVPPRHNFGPLPLPPAPPTLPAPPTFNFGSKPDEEEHQDLVIDTDKYDPDNTHNRYDPMDPTNDDESGDESSNAAHATNDESIPSNTPSNELQPLSEPPPLPPMLNLLAGIDTSSINVPANVLDTAVRQVLEEHRNLIAPTTSTDQGQSGTASDGDSDGDCPNFSIYSATSVHIASSGMDESRNFDMTSPANTSAAMKSKEDEYKEKVSKRCPITINTRNPIKIKLNTPSLIKRVSLYDEEDEGQEQTEDADVAQPQDASSPKPDDTDEQDDTGTANVEEAMDTQEPEITDDDATQDGVESLKEAEGTTPPEVPEIPPDITPEPKTPDIPDKEPSTPDLDESRTEEDFDDGDKEHDDKEHDEANKETPEDKKDDDEHESATPLENGDKTDAESEEHDDASEKELNLSPAKKDADEGLEKMTESISETEDERSYTPCLDENKSKDTSLETEKEKGIEGLDTEMISEEEGNEMFSEEDKEVSPPKTDAESPEDKEESKKKKKKESKKDKEGKEKKSKKKSEISFKKLSKSGKERNYRDKDKDKDKDKEKNKKERRSSEERKKRKEKRKDLERYDVRTVVTEKRKRVKDAFGRDVSPQRDGSGASRSPSPKRRGSFSPRRSPSPRRKSISRRRSSSPRRMSLTPRKRTMSPRRRSISPRRRSISPRRRSITPRRISPVRRKSITPRRKSITPRRKSISPRRKSLSPRRKSAARRSTSRGRKRRSTSRRKRRRSASRSPKPKNKKKKRVRSVERVAIRRPSRTPRRKSPKRKRAKRTPTPTPPRLLADWSPPSVDSRLLSPRTPPPGPSPIPMERPRRHRRDPDRHHRHTTTGPSKEVFTSGDNILVSVSFKDQERDRDAGDKRKRREAKRDKRRKRRRAAAAETDNAKPVAIIDLERSPFRELTPSPKNVIVLSDSDHGEKESERVPPPAPDPPTTTTHVGPKTPPEPPAQPVKFALPAKPQPVTRAPNPLREEPAEQEPAGPATPPDSPDAYDPFEPTRSASASPEPAPQSPRADTPPRTHITLEGAQKTNMSADDVIDRRPISPIEKVMALLQSTRDVPPDPPPGDSGAPPAETTPVAAPAPTAPPAAPPAAPAPLAARIVLPEPRSAQPPKLFLAKPSPIKSNPVKPMQATKISRLPLPIAIASRRDIEDDSPYSPGSSDFGDLFEPPGGSGGNKGKRGDAFDSLFGDGKPSKRRNRNAAKVPVKLNRKKGTKLVGVKIDDDNLKILDDLPSSAVEMQVKSKFLKKLNRQERVVEEVKLVLKPHYNKKRVTKDEYKDILRRTVPKICHNKSGEINPTKIQALVEAYVKKYRKKHKLGLA